MQVEQSRAENRPDQARAEQRKGDLRRTDRLRHPDTAIPRRTRGGTVRQSTSKAEHSSGTAFDEAQLNSTRLDWVWVWVWVLVRAGDESVDGGDDSLSSFQSSLAPFLRLSVSFPATRRFLIEMFCTIFLRITTCCLRHREAAISAFPFPPSNAKCPSRFERVQRATCNNNNLAK